MKLDNIELYQFLKGKEILYLYHANTVATSVSFILSGGLLSRGNIDRSRLTQTIQASDDEDKEFDVWDDVFLDTADLHGYFPRQNLYGPVLFKFKICFLLNDDVDIWITKNNPMYWDSTLSDEDKYFQSVEELIEKWDSYDRQKKMITIRKASVPVLFSVLDEIRLDDPEIIIHGDTNVFIEMKNALFSATEGFHALRTKFKVRKCSHCYCKNNYLNQVTPEQSARLFLPKEHLHFPDK